VVALWGGFPLAFGVILPDLFLPLIVTLFALVLRGASVEIISHTSKPREGWYVVFGSASLVAAFAQGVALGSLTSHLTIVDGAFSGTAFGAFSWFSVIMGVTVVLAYTALGYAFLKLRLEGGPRIRAARRGSVIAVLAVVFGIVSLVTINTTAAPLNLGTPGRAIAFWAVLAFAVAGAIIAATTFRRTERSRSVDILPFAGLALATVAVLVAFVVARYPVFVPPGLTIASAAAPRNTMVFLLVGIGLNMPLVLFYNWYAHHVFAGKLTIGQHDGPPRANLSPLPGGIR
jgi:cytochrome d ubiquinol oxidase subunit II